MVSVEISNTAFTAPVAGEYIFECWGAGSMVAMMRK